MRIAALALAWFLGAAASTVAAAAEVGPALDLKPYPRSAPASPPASTPAADVHAFAPSRARAEAQHPLHGRVCFSQAEARDKIIQLRLTDPVSATRAGRAEGEALRTRLCRWKQDELVYEVYVLRRDGRILHLYVNARDGQTVSAADMADHN